jgi:uncharacterized protein involved in outer membrane biogenesis
MGPRPRRMWRRAVRVVLWVLGALVALVGVAFLLLHTDWARDQVRGVLVAQLTKKLNGTVEVARLEGDLLDRITIRGLVVKDRKGVEVIKADALTVDYRILPLLDQHFHADLIDVEGLEAELYRLPDGRLAVADLWIQTPPTDDPPWTVTLADVKVRRSAVKLERAPGQWDTVRGIEIAAGLQVLPGETRISLPGLEAEWIERKLDFAVRGDVLLPKDRGVVATGIDVWAGRNHIMVPHADWGPTARTVTLVADVPAAELAKLWPESKLLADVRVAGFLTQDPSTERISGNLFGGAGKGSISVTGELAKDASSGDVALFWSGIEPHTIWDGAPEGRLQGFVAGNVTGLSTDSPKVVTGVAGRLRGAVGGQLRGVAISSVKLDASLAQRRVTGDLAAAARFGSASVKLAALLPAVVEDHRAIALERGDVELKVREMADAAAALGQPPGARGPISLTARASGRLDDLTVRADVKSAHVTQKDLKLTGLSAELGLRHLDPAKVPGGAIGSAEVHVGSIVSGGKPYGKASVVATLSHGGRRADVRFNAGGRSGYAARGALAARIAPDGARVVFRDLRITTRKLVWQGKGGSLEVADGGRKLAADLGLSSSAGAVRVTTKLTRRGDDLRGPVRWKLAKLDLARLLGTFDIDDVRGRINSSGEVQLPAGPGRIDVDAAQVSWQGAPQPIGGRLRVDLARRKLSAKADIDAGDLGKATATVAMRAPALLTDGKAWKRMRAGAIQSVQVDATKVDLARLSHSTSKDGTGAKLRSALATLKIQAGPGLETGTISASVKGAEVAASTDVVVPVSVTVDAKLARAQLDATARIDGGDHGKVEVDASLAVPGQPLDAASWNRRGLELLRSATVRVRDFNLDRLDRLRGKKGRSLALTGMVQAELTAGAGARELSTKVSFRDVRAVDMAQPISGEFTAKGQAGSTDLALAVRLKSGPLLDGSLRIGLGADDVRSLDFSRLGNKVQATALRGQLRIPEMPVVRLASALDATPAISGQLSGQLTVGGSVARPILNVRIDAPGLTAEGIRFDRLQIRGAYQAGPWRADIDARQSDGGRVLLKASGGADQRSPLKVHLTTRQLRLSLFTPLFKKPGGMLTYLQGVLNTELDIGGTTEQPLIDGTVQIRNGEARLANFLRPVTKARVDVQFRRSQGKIAVRAESRPGKLALDGNIDVRRLAQMAFGARLSADDLPVQAGKQLIRLDGKIGARGARRGAMWDMNVQIERGVIVRLPSRQTAQLHDTGELSDVRFVDAAGLAQEEAREELKQAAGPAMRVRIKSDGPIAVRSSDDSLRLDLELDLTSTKVGGMTAVDGNVKVARGWVDVLGRRYTVERGWVRFGGEMPPNPGLDIRVAHQFPEVTVYIDVGGRVSNPTVTFASDSGQYDQAQLLGMVLGGDASSGGGGETGADPTDKAANAAAGLVANQVAGVIRKAGLPVDVLRVGSDPEAGSSGLNVVTVGKWLTDRLFVAFRVRNLEGESDKNQGEGTFQHFFTRDWMWEGVVGPQENSIDLLWIVPLGR